MLTISKPLSAGQAQTYHTKEFTSKEQNYWSQKGEIRSEWQGQLVSRFGLAGAVSAIDFARLSQGQHPEMGCYRHHFHNWLSDLEPNVFGKPVACAGVMFPFASAPSCSAPNAYLLQSNDEIRDQCQDGQ